MWGGYLSDDEAELHTVMDTLHRRIVLPALSCGMHPGIVNTTAEKFGTDFPSKLWWCSSWDTLVVLYLVLWQCVRPLNKAPGAEFRAAIDKWGYETGGGSLPEWVLEF